MTMKRKFTKEEKLQIIKEASEQGVKATLEKHGIYPASYYSWRTKLEQMGEEGFHHGMTPEHLKRIRELEKENNAIKQLLAEKELDSKLKGDLLKKKWALEKKTEIVARYISQGQKRDSAWSIAGISKHQYHHKPRKGKEAENPPAIPSGLPRMGIMLSVWMIPW